LLTLVFISLSARFDFYIFFSHESTDHCLSFDGPYPLLKKEVFIVPISHSYDVVVCLILYLNKVLPFQTLS
jgi:hypothetical protein